MKVLNYIISNVSLFIVKLVKKSLKIQNLWIKFIVQKHVDDNSAEIMKDITSGYLAELMNDVYSKHTKESGWKFVTERFKHNMQHRPTPTLNSVEVEDN